MLSFYRFRTRAIRSQDVFWNSLPSGPHRVTSSIIAFRDLINSAQGFKVYKTLVGFQSVFPPAWEDETFDIHVEEQYRSERISELVDSINAENSGEWLSILTRCAQTESDDLATFPSFGRFLEKFGKNKPEILFGYLDRLDARLAGFLPSMLQHYLLRPV